MRSRRLRRTGALRRNGDCFTYVCAAPCEMVDPALAPHRQQDCLLFVDHTPGHSGEFEDLLHDWE
ncbi:hypothetical protein ACPXCP_18220 [Streptomyces sp. DT20]|uniref:hypothetical protein n=1 Tax=unclassified Streptomyces TaxID=2593676 RepID=UPI00093E02A5|nr:MULTISPECIES: hypothetical protein [unclassified Streptomyces]OKK18745.1 hypothetical protein AMK09_17615 [Streptomyces sp. CB02488]